MKKHLEEFNTSYPITSTFMLIKEKLLSISVSNKNQEIFKYKTSALRWWEQYLWHYFVVCSVSSSLTKTSQSHILNCSCSMSQLNSSDMFITNDRLHRVLFLFCGKTTATLFFSLCFSSPLYTVHVILPLEVSYWVLFKSSFFRRRKMWKGHLILTLA